MRTTAVAAVAVIAGLVIAVFMAGCGGGLATDTGAAEGYLYLPDEGTTVVDGYVYRPASGFGSLIVSDSPTPPAGYVPVDGAIVSLSSAGRQTSTTNAAGYFVIVGLPPGDYEITITFGDLPPLHITVKGSPVAVIISSSPNPPPGFSPGEFVILQFTGGVVTLTEPNGYFYAGSLPTGPVTVTITINGYPPFTIMVWIYAGQVHTGGFGQFG